jgi:tRNA-dependent cyclodipeptide synthase
VSRHLQLRVKRQSGWHKIPIDQRHASIEISTRNERCTGDYLAEQLNWARDRFATFQFSIGDTLQIYNYLVLGHPHYSKVDDGLAHKLCLEEGDGWLDDNRSLIQDLLAGKPCSFLRWDELKASPSVAQNLRNLVELYKADEQIFDLVRQDVAGYLERRGHQVAALSEEQLNQLDQHVLEELAVYQYQAEEQNLISVYPGTNQLLLRPKYLTSVDLPQGLKRRHYVTLDIKPVEAGYLVTASRS